MICFGSRVRFDFVQRIVIVVAFVSVGVSCAVADAVNAHSLYDDFVEPPPAARPWTYWLVRNSHTDQETIDADFDDISRLGFGGVLASDSRDYHVDDDHVRYPPAKIQWGGPEWQEMMAQAIRAAARNGLSFSLNIAASGGHLRGDVDALGDNPKHLIFRRYRPGELFEIPKSPYFREVAIFAIRSAEVLDSTGWLSAGDGVMSVASSKSARLDAGRCKEVDALEIRELASAAEGSALDKHWTIVRLGSDIIPNVPNDIDILDAEAVKRHLVRVVGGLLDKVPDLVGTNRTFRALYNVSWEGLMPTWSATFEDDFKRFAGRPLRPNLPILAGFRPNGVDVECFRRSYRRARGLMMLKHFYLTVRDWAHERGMLAFSESGGPWRREPELFGECDQITFLLANDIPQGEFWLQYGAFDTKCDRHANSNGRYLTRAIASAAHVGGLRYASAEAFTHCYRHWSVDPAYIKPIGDQAFADGINRLVFHTYTSSPARFGVPGMEYFAGTHINRNVTWHDDFAPFVKYLGRCQSVLQSGESVVDVLVVGDDCPYSGFVNSDNKDSRGGGDRGKFLSGEPKLAVRLPTGYACDFVSSTVFENRQEMLRKQYPVVVTAEKAVADPSIIERLACAKGFLPDVVVKTAATPWTWCHRRISEGDFYYLVGEGKGEVTFRSSAQAVEAWNPVTGVRTSLSGKSCGEGRTRLDLELPQGGSVVIAFLKKLPREQSVTLPNLMKSTRVDGPWDVSFSYLKGVSAKPPSDIRLAELVDFRDRKDVCHFSGFATYRACFDFDDTSEGSVLSLGVVPSGLAHVWVNGIDCGTVWCDPWQVDVSSAVRRGSNQLTIRYVNNWSNRLIGDCQMVDSERVTKTNVRCWKEPRMAPIGKTWPLKPTVTSGYCPNDPLQPSGLLGPIEVLSCGQTKAPVFRDVPYDAKLGPSGVGDILLPDDIDETTPVALVIHGGGWKTGSREDMAGIAEYLRRDLGFAVYNIEYRLGSERSRWPSCGEDCVRAAQYLLSAGFRERFGVSTKKIWIVGASAGGHLSLWTLTHLPKESVEGVVSISSIGDPVPDFKVHKARYKHLFGEEVTASDVAAVDPRPSIGRGMAPLLCTHAEGDRVVPIASHRAFAEAYTAAGNEVEFFAYPCDCVPGLTGHCIWRPLFRSKKLIPHLETRIADFVRRVRGRVSEKKR